MRFLVATGPGRTGGPEALHQLVHTLTSLGAEASIIYLNEFNGVLVLSDCAQNQYPEYAGIKITSQLLIDGDTILVLPEVWVNHALDFAKNCKVLVWWLSVDNGLLSLGKIAFYLDLFRSHPRIFHAYQSAYAKEFLNSLGLSQIQLPLSDFVGGDKELARMKLNGQQLRPIQICFNPLKGAWLAQLFQGNHPNATYIPISQMDRNQIKQVFMDSDFYVDFGHLPGKDRLPREAIKSGTRVFLRDCGDGFHSSDWLLPNHCYFSAEDCSSGALWKSLQYERMNGAQEMWRPAQAKIAEEEKLFKNECQNLINVFASQGQSKSIDFLIDQINATHRYPDRLTKAEQALHDLRSSSSWKYTSWIRGAVSWLRGAGPSSANH